MYICKTHPVIHNRQLTKCLFEQKQDLNDAIEPEFRNCLAVDSTKLIIKEDLANIRPITNLAFCILKCLKRVAASQTKHHLIENCLLPRLQAVYQ